MPKNKPTPPPAAAPSWATLALPSALVANGLLDMAMLNMHYQLVPAPHHLLFVPNLPGEGGLSTLALEELSHLAWFFFVAGLLRIACGYAGCKRELLNHATAGTYVAEAIALHSDHAMFPELRLSSGFKLAGTVGSVCMLLAMVLATPVNDEDDGIDEDVFGDNEKED